MSHAGKAPRLGLIRKDVPTRPSANSAFNPHEIVDLMSRYYQLLSRMRYFPESYIKYAPHDPPVDVEYAASLGMESQVIELLQLLPYVDSLNNEDEFIIHGSFADLRENSVLEQSRDPKFLNPEKGFDVENGEYVRPWMLVLTECGNHGSIVYYNTRNGHMMLEDFYGGSLDPVFSSRRNISPPSLNQNSIENLPSRPAKEMLEDFMSCHQRLEWIPFYLNAYRIFREGEPHHDELKQLFEYYGWHNNFDGPAFDIAADRWRTFNSVRGLVEEVRRKVPQVKHLSSITERRLHEYLKRRQDGVWDGNPNLPAEEVSKLEKELEKRQRAYQIVSEQLADAEDVTENMVEEDEEFEKAWKKQIESYIQWIRSNLEFLKRDGGKFEVEEETKKMEEDIRGLERKLENVASLPKTSEEAMKPPGPTAIRHEVLKYVI
ncbi:hypothetical protein N431DRAFT_371044 [Stipitochalara longipes BDJ]|nr:hypothetical protein N431DRAFT_371044 [Stipitochalara longipes BDJ]